MRSNAAAFAMVAFTASGRSTAPSSMSLSTEVASPMDSAAHQQAIELQLHLVAHLGVSKCGRLRRTVNRQCRWDAMQ